MEEKKWISFEEWKSLKEWQIKKEMEILPLWMILYLYNMTVMEIESKFSNSIKNTEWFSGQTELKEEYKWDVLK